MRLISNFWRLCNNAITWFKHSLLPSYFFFIFFFHRNDAECEYFFFPPFAIAVCVFLVQYNKCDLKINRQTDIFEKLLNFVNEKHSFGCTNAPIFKPNSVLISQILLCVFRQTISVEFIPQYMYIRKMVKLKIRGLVPCTINLSGDAFRQNFDISS